MADLFRSCLTELNYRQPLIWLRLRSGARDERDGTAAPLNEAVPGSAEHDPLIRYTRRREPRSKASLPPF